MTFQELAKKRYSVRRYSTEPVTQEQLDYILECARIAPSAVNFQPWHFYIARTPETIQKLQQTYNEEPAVLIPLGHPHPEDGPRGTTRKEMDAL